MTDYRPMPKHVDWSLLITLLRKTYSHGDGGLPADSGIDAGVLADGVKNGVHSLENGITLWNLSVDRVQRGLMRREDIDRCVLTDEKLAS